MIHSKNLNEFVIKILNVFVDYNNGLNPTHRLRIVTSVTPDAFEIFF